MERAPAAEVIDLAAYRRARLAKKGPPTPALTESAPAAVFWMPVWVFVPVVVMTMMPGDGMSRVV